MLPDAGSPGPASLMMLLAWFGSLFTAPSFRAFCGLACGFLAQAGIRVPLGKDLVQIARRAPRRGLRIRPSPRSGVAPAPRPAWLIAEILSLLAGNKLAGTGLHCHAADRQLSVSKNTVRTHLRHVYEKLGAHSLPGPSSGPVPSACSRRHRAGHDAETWSNAASGKIVTSKSR